MATKKQKSPTKTKTAATSKKSAAKKTAAKKTVAKKPAPKKPAAAKNPAPKKSAAKKPATKKPAAKKPVEKAEKKVAPKKLSATARAFLKRQEGRLLALKDTLLDSMNGVAKDNLRAGANGGDASAFGLHTADAGSDAYDRDFALSLLSQEQDSLYEIDEALKRITLGSYGICEISNKAIPHPRLEALPFTRYTVECQADLEKRNHFRRNNQNLANLFGSSDDDDDDSGSDSKD